MGVDEEQKSGRKIIKLFFRGRKLNYILGQDMVLSKVRKSKKE